MLEDNLNIHLLKLITEENLRHVPRVKFIRQKHIAPQTQKIQ